MAFELRRDDVLDCFAARICRAAPELVSGVFTLLRGAKDHLTTASRAPPPDSGLAAARLKIGDVLAASCEGCRKAVVVDARNDLINLFDRDYLLAKGLDEPDVLTTSNDIRGEVRLETGCSRKDDDGVDRTPRDFQRCLERPHVCVVLAQRVLELERVPENPLGPLSVILGTEDPPSHVLCFDHKDAEARNDDVIDLRCPAIRSQSYVMK